MKFLNPPILDARPADIFEKCVESYTDENKKKRLLTCKRLVEIDSDNYRCLVPAQIDKFIKSSLPANVTTTELKAVYEEKFAKDKTAGRIYYDKIKEQAERSICPICGVRIVSTLDHYLPKSKIPTLAVTPDNLFPSCKDCNIDKKTDMVLDSQSTPVHLYYDRLPDDPWLHVNVGTNLEITYYILCPESWEEALRGRVEKHLDIYHLHKLYSAHASSEIEDKRHMWKKLFKLGSENAVFEDICEMRSSAETNDLNSWKSALYRGLEQEFEKVKAWLLDNCLEQSEV